VGRDGNSFDFDVVVIGAGPAGALSALLAARAGAHTLLVDRASFPREKVCGCCLASQGRAVLEEAGIASAVLSQGRAVDHVTVRVGGNAKHPASASFTVPSYTTIERAVMDSAMVQECVRAGVVFRDGTSASLDANAGGVLLGGTELARARTVVVADGLGSSSLRRDDRFAWKQQPHSHVGLGATLSGKTAHELACAFDSQSISMTVGTDGYVGAARLSTQDHNTWSVAAAVLPSAIRAHKNGACGVVHGILEQAGIDSAWTSDVSFKGTPTLTRRRSAIEADGRVFLVGDATGYVEPFTGEGMSWALTGAHALRDYIMSSLRGSYRHGEWTVQAARMARRGQLGCKGVAWLLRRPALACSAVRLMNACPNLGRMLQRAIVGDGESRRGGDIVGERSMGVAQRSMVVGKDMP